MLNPVADKLAMVGLFAEQNVCVACPVGAFGSVPVTNQEQVFLLNVADS